jgi:hypothetical protein
MDNNLVKLAESSPLEKTKSQVIMDNFKSFFEEINQWELKAKSIKITDVSQVAEMQQAREIRLHLKDIRVNAEKVKKKLKENILQEGRFIDGAYNLIAGTIKPLEDDLLKKEKYVEKLEEERLNKIQSERAEKLSKFEVDPSFYDLRSMPDNLFSQLLADSEKNYNIKKEAEEKAEKDRLEQEKREAEEKEKLRLENERLKKEAEEREKKQAKERAKQEKLEAERLKRLRIQKEELEAQQRAIAAEKAEKERIEKEEAEKKRQASLAPDKDKLLSFAITIDTLELPMLNDVKAIELLSNVKEKLTGVSNYIRENANNL